MNVDVERAAGGRPGGIGEADLVVVEIAHRGRRAADRDDMANYARHVDARRPSGLDDVAKRGGAVEDRDGARIGPVDRPLCDAQGAQVRRVVKDEVVGAARGAVDGIFHAELNVVEIADPVRRAADRDRATAQGGGQPDGQEVVALGQAAVGAGAAGDGDGARIGAVDGPLRDAERAERGERIDGERGAVAGGVRRDAVGVDGVIMAAVDRESGAADGQRVGGDAAISHAGNRAVAQVGEAAADVLLPLDRRRREAGGRMGGEAGAQADVGCRVARLRRHLRGLIVGVRGAGGGGASVEAGVALIGCRQSAVARSVEGDDGLPACHGSRRGIDAVSDGDVACRRARTGTGYGHGEEDGDGLPHHGGIGEVRGDGGCRVGLVDRVRLTGGCGARVVVAVPPISGGQGTAADGVQRDGRLARGDGSDGGIDAVADGDIAGRRASARVVDGNTEVDDDRLARHRRVGWIGGDGRRGVRLIDGVGHAGRRRAGVEVGVPTIGDGHAAAAGGEQGQRGRAGRDRPGIEVDAVGDRDSARRHGRRVAERAGERVGHGEHLPGNGRVGQVGGDGSGDIRLVDGDGAGVARPAAGIVIDFSRGAVADVGRRRRVGGGCGTAVLDIGLRPRDRSPHRSEGDGQADDGNEIGRGDRVARGVEEEAGGDGGRLVGHDGAGGGAGLELKPVGGRDHAA